MANSPTDQTESASNKEDAANNAETLPGIQVTSEIPKRSPPQEYKDAPSKKYRYTNDYGIFWINLIGLIVLAIYSNYTREQVNIARDVEERQLRAYIIVEPGHVTIVRNGIEGVVNVRNAGITPAYKVIVEGWSGLNKFPLPDQEYGYKKADSFVGKNPVVVAPSQVGFGFEIIRPQLSMSEREKLQTGNVKRFYVVGDIRYTDIFGLARQTNFCFGFWGIDNVMSHVDPCEKHNDAD